MVKSNLEYEVLFETLMQYTSFTNVDQIDSPKKLSQFFNDIKNQNDSFNASHKLRQASWDAIQRLQGTQATTGNVRTIHTKRQQVIDSQRGYDNYESAFRQKHTAVTLEGIPFYRGKDGKFRRFDETIIDTPKLSVHELSTSPKEYNKQFSVSEREQIEKEVQAYREKLITERLKNK